MAKKESKSGGKHKTKAPTTVLFPEVAMADVLATPLTRVKPAKTAKAAQPSGASLGTSSRSGGASLASPGTGARSGSGLATPVTAPVGPTGQAKTARKAKPPTPATAASKAKVPTPLATFVAMPTLAPADDNATVAEEEADQSAADQSADNATVVSEEVVVCDSDVEDAVPAASKAQLFLSALDPKAVLASVIPLMTSTPNPSVGDLAEAFPLFNLLGPDAAALPALCLDAYTTLCTITFTVMGSDNLDGICAFEFAGKFGLKLQDLVPFPLVPERKPRMPTPKASVPSSAASECSSSSSTSLSGSDDMSDSDSASDASSLSEVSDTSSTKHPRGLSYSDIMERVKQAPKVNLQKKAALVNFAAPRTMRLLKKAAQKWPQLQYKFAGDKAAKVYISKKKKDDMTRVICGRCKKHMSLEYSRTGGREPHHFCWKAQYESYPQGCIGILPSRFVSSRAYIPSSEAPTPSLPTLFNTSHPHKFPALLQYSRPFVVEKNIDMILREASKVRK